MVFLVSLYSNLFTSGSFDLEGRREVFMPSSSVFLFDNILVLSWVCYHVPYCPLHFSIASLCPSMQLLNALIN